MNTEEMVLAATPGPRPDWGRTTGGLSKLVEVAQGELALRAAARLLDEHAARLGHRIAEVARARTPDGKYEAVYGRCEPLDTPQEEPAPANTSAVQALGEQVDKMTAELSKAVLGTNQ